MLETRLFGEELKKFGFKFYCGVPCSFLKNFINYAINECNYIAAVNEGDAVAIASGAFLGGEKSVVLMQNSGLPNAAAPLISLNYPFRIPMLGFVSLRGEIGIPDEPQHELMGQITEAMLNTIGIKHEYLSEDFEEAKKQLIRANKEYENNRSFFFIVRDKIFTKETLLDNKSNTNKNVLTRQKISEEQIPARLEAIKAINTLKDSNTILMATTGKTGRELYEVDDSPNNFYMVGSMGCIGDIGLGLALVRKDKNIVVIDGDGALLMRMGTLAINGHYCPSNLLHILLDNNSYDSTGGQSTISSNVSFVDIAAACGYTHSIYAHNLNELENFIKEWKINKKLTFIYLRISKGSSENLGRPKVKPYEVKERVKVFINGKISSDFSSRNGK